MGKSSSAAGKVAAYTAQDLDKVRSIEAWFKEHEQSRSWLAKKLRVSSGTVSQVLNQKYPSAPTSHLDAMLAVLQVESERLGDGTPGYVDTTVHKMATVVCDRTRKQASFGVLVGSVGVGKTRTLKEYAKRHPQTLVVEANPGMTPGSLLIELLTQLNVLVPHGLDRKFAAVVAALKDTNYLVVADEAETMSAQALHHLRRVRDKAGVGIVFSGTEKLHQLIKPEHGQFEQIRSRVAMWPATIKTITRDDADELARAGLTDEFGELGDDVLDALWALGAGSARVLMESLVPTVRDYAPEGSKLTAALVEKIAEKVLFMKRTSGGKA